MVDARATSAKYVFLDVVGFTKKLHVQAQSSIIRTLNRIVKNSLEEHRIPKTKKILLPTGDGICVVLLKIDSPFDIHIKIALSIIEGIRSYNEKV